MFKQNKVFIEQDKIKKDKFCCQICNYPVLSSKNKCCHQFCDYCLTTQYSSKLAECKICEVIQRRHNGSFRQT
jgi:hypothetical protein